MGGHGRPDGPALVGHRPSADQQGCWWRYAAEFQALDSLRVAEALDRRLQAEGHV